MKMDKRKNNKSVVSQNKRMHSTCNKLHSIMYYVYSKLAKDRKTLEKLAGSRVIAIAVDRSTGLYELFGADQGLKLSGLERAYTGSQNSNFYTVTLATPDIAVIRESSIAQLAVNIVTAVA